MKQINIVVMNEHIKAVNEIIVEQGCLHPVKYGESEGITGLQGFHNENVLSEYRLLGERIDKITENCEIDFPEIKPEEYKKELDQLDCQQVRDRLSALESEYINLENAKKSLKIKNDSLEKIGSQYDDYSDFLELLHMKDSGVLEQFTGQIPTIKLGALQGALAGIPHLLFPVKEEKPWTVIVLAVLKKDVMGVKKSLGDFNYQEVTVSEEIKNDGQRGLERFKLETENVKKKRELISQNQERFHQKLIEELPVLDFYVAYMSLMNESQQYFKKTDRTCIISGFIPGDNVRVFVKSVKQVTSGQCYIEVREPSCSGKKEKVPYLFKNNFLFRPFEGLVKAYGIPEYRSIDPTPIFALSYMFMFGFMFGDVGDGLVLTLIGCYILLSKRFKVDLRQAGLLLTYCGIASMAFGLLYGSVFGVEDWIPALWLRPLHEINKLLKIGLFFGIGMISLGILINMINGVLTKNWSRAIFDKAGLLGGLIYWGAIGLIAKSYFLGNPASGWLWFAFIGLPCIMLFLKKPFEVFVEKKTPHEESLFTYLMEVVFEIVEIFMGYLANTFSFIRVGAFALSHAGLFVAIFSLAALVRQSAHGAVWSIVVLIFGNIIILLLEGMVVAIQAVRLEYYEFFTKFFVGEGILYKPISLKNKK